MFSLNYALYLKLKETDTKLYARMFSNKTKYTLIHVVIIIVVTDHAYTYPHICELQIKDTHMRDTAENLYMCGILLFNISNLLISELGWGYTGY